MSTIFEKIITREIPADIVFEDEQCLAFLDIRPNSKGHTLIVPKQCFVNIFDADDVVLAHMMSVAKKVADALTHTTNATGVNIIMNNGKDAGQEVFHAHIHIIPRKAGDGVFSSPRHIEYADGESQLLAEQIKNALA